MNLTKSLILSTVLVLSGCSLFTPKEVIVKETEIIEKQIPIVDRPAPLELGKLKFKVVTKDNVDEFLRDLQTEEVYVIMTIQDYQILSTNIADLKQYIIEQKEIIIYYEESIKN